MPPSLRHELAGAEWQLVSITTGRDGLTSQRLKELLGQRARSAAGRALGATSSLAGRFTTD
jgi:hypothetical protein